MKLQAAPASAAVFNFNDASDHLDTSASSTMAGSRRSQTCLTNEVDTPGTERDGSTSGSVPESGGRVLMPVGIVSGDAVGSNSDGSSEDSESDGDTVPAALRPRLERLAHPRAPAERSASGRRGVGEQRQRHAALARLVAVRRPGGDGARVRRHQRRP